MFGHMLRFKTFQKIHLALHLLWFAHLPLHAQTAPGTRPSLPPPPDLAAQVWSINSASGIELVGIKAPFTLYDALWRQRKIEHPYNRQASDSLQWVEQQIWICRMEFEADSTQAARSDARIVFEQIMTHARVYLNGKNLGETKNAFRQYSFPVGKLMTAGTNQLEVHLLPIQRLNDSLAADHIPLPEHHRAFVRQAAYTFGWDWGPRLAAGGITGSVRMEWSTTPHISQLNHRVLRADSAHGEIEAEVRFRGAPAGSRIRLQLTGKDCRLEQTQTMIGRADTLFRTRFKIPQPHLWWTHDLGHPHLYKLTATLYLPHEPENDLYLEPTTERKQQQVGLRTVELIQTPDDSGSSYVIHLNGHPLFVRGANAVPGGYLTDKRTSDPLWGRQPETAPLAWARAAHINMLRMWGGGNYPSDAFYHCADSLGILLWQDAAFACAMYPSQNAFREEVEMELRQQISRLRSHPSLALWCGNNENYEGWHNWGWQKSLKYSAQDSLAVWKGYEQLFMKDIPELLQELDSGRAYTHSSPLTGWGRPEAYRQGDVHYWGVWWGLDSIEQYSRKVGRFVSEYGMQSFPHVATLRQFAGNNEEDLFYESPAMKHHQRHPTGTATLNTYLGRDYPPASNPGQYAYLTQLLQHRAIETAIKAHRTSKPYCMGSLFWQWNDAWPGISWSAVDYLGRPKALYHRLKTLYQPVWVDIDTAQSYSSRQIPSGRPRLVAVNDTREAVEVTVELQLWHCAAQKALKISRKNILIPHGAALSDPWPRSLLADKRLRKPGYFVVVEWKQAGQKIGSHWWVPHRPLQQKWEDPQLQLRTLGMGLLELRSTRPARFVHLQMESPTDDDYFDLLPGQTKIVNFIPHYAETYPPRAHPLSFYDLLGTHHDRMPVTKP